MKIYESSENVTPSLQSYFNYLPEDDIVAKDRSMLYRNKRNCPKHNRFLIFFNYPLSCKPKTALMTPYIGDNIIALNSYENANLLTWLEK